MAALYAIWIDFVPGMVPLSCRLAGVGYFTTHNKLDEMGTLLYFDGGSSLEKYGAVILQAGFLTQLITMTFWLHVGCDVDYLSR